MKKTQWQFTHRPDNQADIKRILREAREDGLTLVEVKGGPESLRGVYLDYETIKPNARYWPGASGTGEITIGDLHISDSVPGWSGPWRLLAPAVKRAHEQFCKNLEAAQAQPKREYPPTVSVRAAGPELSQPTPGVALPKKWFESYVTECARWLPKPGELFTVSGYRPEFSVFKGSELSHYQEQDRLLEGKVFECVSVDPATCDRTPKTIAEYGNCIMAFEHGGDPKEDHAIRTRTWVKIEPANPTPYIPKVGDKFTAKAVSPNALVEISEKPHGEVLTCVFDSGSCLAIDFPDNKGFTITKKYYEFKKVEEKPAEPYIPQPGDRFTAKGIAPGALSETISAPHTGVFECLANKKDAWLTVRCPWQAVGDWEITKEYYEFKKVEQQQQQQQKPAEPYVPQAGDKFTAKAVSPNALVEILNKPHGDVLTCVRDYGSCLRIEFPNKIDYTITKAYYEFRKVQS